MELLPYPIYSRNAYKLTWKEDRGAVLPRKKGNCFMKMKWTKAKREEFRNQVQKMDTSS